MAAPALFVIPHTTDSPIPARPQLTRRQIMFNLCRRPLPTPSMELKDAKLMTTSASLWRTRLGEDHAIRA
jgi:hypothetical protein